MSFIPWWTLYPYVNDEAINLDWLLSKVTRDGEKLDDFITINSIKYADPILWDITSQYEANTITVDPQTGDAYISTTAVPYGTSLSNTDYWTKIYNYADAVNTLMGQIAIANERLSTTASATRSIGDLVWLNGQLYEVIAAMIAGDSYVENSNCIKTTVEEYINTRITAINQTLAYMGDLANLSTTDKSTLVAAINEVLSTITTKTGDLANLSTTDKSTLVAAINEVLFTITTITGNLANLSTTDKSTLVAAINEVLSNMDDYLKNSNTVPASLMTYNSTPVDNISRLNVVDGNNTTPSNSDNNPSVMINRVDDSYHGDTSKNVPQYILYDLYATMKRVATSCGYASTILGYMEDNTENGTSPGGSTQSVAVSGMAYVTKNSSVWGLYGDVYNKSAGLANAQGCELNVHNETGVDYQYNANNPVQYPFSCGNWIVTGGNADNSFAIGISTFDIANSHWHVGEYYAPYAVIDIGIDMQATPTTNIKLHGAKTDPLNAQSRGGIGIDFDGHYSLDETVPEVNHGAIHLHNEAICFGDTGLGHILFNQNNGTLEFWYNGARRGYINMGGTDHEL